tara:strand:+ start:3718 stop:4560 length:843 start_codon:yes stop_codon:yes gene_type:complete
MNALELIKIGSSKLKHKSIESHQIDSEILLSSVLGKTREETLVNLNEEINFENISKFNNLITRRSLYEPIAYILRKKEFWSKIFEVNQDTLIPRPETELLVEKLCRIYKDKNISILDIGTGSGCILISLLSELNKSKGVGLDISKQALLIAQKNAIRHQLTRRIKFLNKSFTNIYNRSFDLIVSNPPYIERRELNNLAEDIKKYEPLLALDGGNDGLDVIKKVIYKSKEILKINGRLALEIGNKQYRKVSSILKKNSFKIEYNIEDYNNNIRCLISSLNK